MKKGIIAIALLAGATAMAGIIDDAVFHVNFAGDSVDDTHASGGGTSTGTGNNMAFTDISGVPGSNGRGAVFNGTDSYIDYGTGAGSELQDRTSLTYHIRVKFDDLVGDQFLMGRWGGDAANNRVSTMFAGGTVINCDASSTGAYQSGYRTSTPGSILAADQWYDIFYRFYGPGDSSGFMQVNVFEVGNDTPVASDPTPVATSLTHLADLPAVLFRVGASRHTAGSPHAPLDGIVDQVNVWDTNIAYADMQSIVVPEPATLGLLSVFGGAILVIRRKIMI